jgi:hypothetical protein
LKRSGLVARWRAFRSLSAGQRGLLLRALLLLPLVRIGLRVVGFVRVKRWLAKTPLSPTVDATPKLREAQQTADIVRVASRYGVYAGNCLDQSLTLWWLLRWQGIPAALQLGVRKPLESPALLNAHAWVEVEGHALNDVPDVASQFAVFPNRDTGALKADG